MILSNNFEKVYSKL